MKRGQAVVSTAHIYIIQGGDAHENSLVRAQKSHKEFGSSDQVGILIWRTP